MGSRASEFELTFFSRKEYFLTLELEIITYPNPHQVFLWIPKTTLHYQPFRLLPYLHIVPRSSVTIYNLPSVSIWTYQSNINIYSFRSLVYLTIGLDHLLPHLHNRVLWLSEQLLIENPFRLWRSATLVPHKSNTESPSESSWHSEQPSNIYSCPGRRFQDTYQYLSGTPSPSVRFFSKTAIHLCIRCYCNW